MIRVVGRIGDHDVDIHVEGFDVADLFAGFALSDTLSEHTRMGTTRQRQSIAKICWQLAEALTTARPTRGAR